MLCFPKANKTWVVKPINKKKSYKFLLDVLSRVISGNKHQLRQRQHSIIALDLTGDITLIERANKTLLEGFLFTLVQSKSQCNDNVF